MYNLLLVDDERAILEGLAFNIDWDCMGIQEVFRAEDAAAALTILKEHPIDLIITDVRMPGMDGITMSETVLRQWPYTKLIFLSGYKDFEYARRAIDVKAFQYVLKPVRYEELEAIVRKAIAELEQDFQKRSIIEEAEQRIHEMQPFLQERYLYLWLEKDRRRPWEEPGGAAECGLELYPEDWGFWLSVQVDHWSGQALNDGVLNVAITELVRLILGTDCRFVPFPNFSGVHNLLFLSPGSEAIHPHFKRIIDRLETLQFSIGQSLSCQVSLFWDYPVPLEQLGEAYRRLHQRIRLRMGCLAGAISGPDPLDPLRSHELKSLHSHPSFATLVSGCRREQALEWVCGAFRELREPELQTQDNILQIYHTVVGTLISDSNQRKIPLAEWGREYQEFFENAHTITTVEAFFELCRSAVAAYFDCVLAHQQNQSTRLAEHLKALIAEQLTTEISVTRLARQFNYNAVYLSRVFKEETGLSLQDYIIRVRIDRAKELLNSGERVGDVAAKVGYENFPHFSRIFKKVVGVSPKQYQSKEGEGR